MARLWKYLWKCYLPFWIFIISGILHSEPDFSFGGYIFEIPVYQIPSGNSPDTSVVNSFFNLTRLRLRPEAFLGENTRIMLNYEIDLVYSSIDIISSSQDDDKTNRQAVDLKWNLLLEKRLKAKGIKIKG